MLRLFLLLSTTILHVYAMIFTDLIGGFEHKVVNLKLPIDLTGKFLKQSIKVESELITGYLLPTFVLDGFLVGVSQAFRDAHVLGNPIHSSQDIELLKDIQRAVFKVPSNAGKWKYGEEKILVLPDFVNARLSKRFYPEHVWMADVDVKALFTVSAKKYKEAGQNGRGKDVILIDKIISQRYQLLKQPESVSAEMLKMDGFEVRVRKELALPKLLEGAKLKVQSDFKQWLYGEPIQLESIDNIKHILGGTEIEEKMFLKATRWKGKELGKDLIVVDRVLTPSSVNGFENGINPISLIKDLPVKFGGVDTWILPNGFIRNIQLRGNRDVINNHVLGNPTPGYPNNFLDMFPTDQMIEFNKNLQIGETGTVKSKKKLFKLQYKRGSTHSPWIKQEVNAYFIEFIGTKYEGNPHPVVVISNWKVNTF